MLHRNGYTDVIGDVLPAGTDEKTTGSLFVDIASDASGLIYALDANRGRIFVYNNEGFLFYVFGGIGTQLGTFATPSAIEVNGTDVLVADQGNPRITVFRRTAYAQMISEADEAYNTGRYDESVDIWNEVIKQNSNFELAYTQIGKVYLRRGQYKQAMDYFELGNFRGDKITNTTGYNKAFSEFRRETAAKWLGRRLSLLWRWPRAGGAGASGGGKRRERTGGRRREGKSKIRFPHPGAPFDGFWDMKREKKGDIRVSLVILALVVVTDILSKQFTAFLFNPDKFAPMDVVFEVNKILLVFLLFCVSNWSVTTLMQGEGTFKDIVMMTGYACLPLVIIPLPVAILSNLAAYSEQVYMNAALTVAYLWFFGLLLAGVMTIHQYTIGKMLGTVLVTIVAMLALVFICLLFFNLFSQLVGFVYSLYKELALRT